MIPPGYRLERRERQASAISGGEVAFDVIEVKTGERIAAPRLVCRRDGSTVILPGMTSAWMTADEARARAAALLAVAEEYDRRSAGASG